MGDVLDNRLLAVAIVFLLGAGQMVVHIYYFLHMNSRAGRRLAGHVLGLHGAIGGDRALRLDLGDVPPGRNMMPAHEQIERVRSLP